MAAPALIAILLAQTAVIAAPSPAGGDWTWFDRDSAGDYFLESATPRVDGPLVRFRLRQRARAGALFHSAIIALRIDCREQTIAMESSATYDEAGAILSTENVPEAWLDSDPIYSGSVYEKLYLRQCPASLRRPLGAQPPPPPIIVMPPPIALPMPIAPPTPPAPPPLPPPDRPPADYPVERTEPLVPLSTLFTQEDYPLAALRADEQGVVRYRLAVGRDGRVSECVITASSGSASLDSATCRILTERARFKPARTARRQRTTDRIAGSIRWEFPEEPLPAADGAPTAETPQ